MKVKGNLNDSPLKTGDEQTQKLPTGFSSLDEASVTVGRQQLRDFIHFAEFKRVLDRVDGYLIKNKPKSICILSLLPQEGKSFMTAALGIAMAELLGKRVLVVDAANPQSSWLLSDLLDADHAQVGSEQIQKIDTRLSYYDLITQSGKTKGAEYRVNEMIGRERDNFDIIIFDSVALRVSNRLNLDPWVLAHRTDAALLVASQRSIGDAQGMTNQEAENLKKLNMIGYVQNRGGLRPNAKS